MQRINTSERVGFYPGQVVIVPHKGHRKRVQIRSIKTDAIAVWLIYFVDRVPYRCPVNLARPVF
ncbi:hypothetical protein J5X98_15865 [Leptothermofonsia sichuanensis E412]|uniref:hypothetical protein n=1 Tax=Leptothermofonsia sichuanensis TaxID=2917832 RepID=UPI001CA78AE7|nr:hypothetical protein [Leptothermofonsia sichuanensis]QZZ18921.1 hypothetical protein J5X98_15865 [Leptothermofonsia sichuanensis E412]